MTVKRSNELTATGIVQAMDSAAGSPLRSTIIRTAAQR